MQPETISANCVVVDGTTAKDLEVGPGYLQNGVYSLAIKTGNTTEPPFLFCLTVVWSYR